MAKDNIALLTEISGQLRKLNQVSIRDKLQERELADRQEAIMSGQQVDPTGDGSPMFIDAGEDFKRRIKGSVAGALSAEKFSASGERARIWLKTNKNKKAPESDAAGNKSLGDMISLMVNTNTILHAQYAFWNQLLTQGKTQIDIDMARQSYLENYHSDEERLRIEQKREDLAKTKDKLLDDNRAGALAAGVPLALPDPSGTTGLGNGPTILGGNLPLLIGAWAITAASMAVSDWIRGYKMDGLDGGISSLLGGNEEGGMANSIRQAFVLGGLGAGIGLMVGGPPGALIGGIIGVAIGALAGYLGAAKINAWMDEAGKNISDAFYEIKGNFLSLGNDIARWIYTPGSKSQSPNHPSINATMFGGLVSWDIDDHGSTFTEAFVGLMNDIISLPGKIGAWIKSQIMEKAPLLGKFLFGDGLTPDERDSHHAKQSLIEAKTKSSVVKDQRERAEILFAGAQGDASELWFGDSWQSIQEMAKAGQYGLTNIGAPGELKFTNDKLISQDADWNAEVAALLAAETERSALKNAQTLMSQQTADRNMIRRAEENFKPYIIPIDSSSSESNVTIMVEKVLGSNLGSGNNSNAIMDEDGNVYSW